jgi:hypothetical protein
VRYYWYLNLLYLHFLFILPERLRWHWDLWALKLPKKLQLNLASIQCSCQQPVWSIEYKICAGFGADFCCILANDLLDAQLFPTLNPLSIFLIEVKEVRSMLGEGLKESKDCGACLTLSTLSTSDLWNVFVQLPKLFCSVALKSDVTAGWIWVERNWT